MCSECNIPHIREITYPQYNKKGTLLCFSLLCYGKIVRMCFYQENDGWKWWVFIFCLLSAIYSYGYDGAMWLRSYEILVGCVERCVRMLARFIRKDLKTVGM